MSWTVRTRNSSIRSNRRFNDNKQTNEHLRYLHDSDRNIDDSKQSNETLSANSVVRIHHHVNEEVHSDEKSNVALRICERMKTVAEYGDVMIPVQKDERLLSQYNKGRVKQFGNFRQTENVHPKGAPFMEGILGTNRLVPTE